MEINVGNIKFSNEKDFVLIGGINVLEDFNSTLYAAKHYFEVCRKLDIQLVFKASYEKANRSSIDSYTGPGMKEGLRILSNLKDVIDIPIITDVHLPEEVPDVSKVCEIIQLPAFLARQTSLIKAMAQTNCLINIKKPQFISPFQAKNIVKKFFKLGKRDIMLCERGTMFGYDNLIVDMLGIGVMKRECFNVPIIFDVTHSLQCRDSFSKSSGGRREQILELAKAGVSTNIAGLFLESHINPQKAPCDGPSALPLDLLEDFLTQVKEVDKLVKNQKKLKIN